MIPWPKINATEKCVEYPYRRVFGQQGRMEISLPCRSHENARKINSKSIFSSQSCEESWKWIDEVEVRLKMEMIGFAYVAVGDNGEGNYGMYETRHLAQWRASVTRNHDRKYTWSYAGHIWLWGLPTKLDTMKRTWQYADRNTKGTTSRF
jgi:hypothetical protein